MMRTALLFVLALLLPLSVTAQEEVPPPPPVAEQPAPPPGEDLPPPLVDQVIPVEPAPPAAEVPPPPPSPQDELVNRAIRYYEQTQEAPPEVGALLARNPWLGTIVYFIGRLSKVIIWLFLFLLIGMGGRKLLRQLLGAPVAPAPQATGYSRDRAAPEAPAPDRRVALADMTAWFIALAIACEAVGLRWIGAFWSGLVGLLAAAFWMAFLLLLAGLIVWSFSERGRRLVLSLLGGFYLTRSTGRPPQGHVFRLPDGREGVIVSTDLLHTVLQPTDGGPPVTVPNAELMEQYYHWAARREGTTAA